LCQSFFERQNVSNSFIFYFFPHFAVMAKDFYACVTNCVGVFRETGSMNYKKGAGTVGLKKRELSKKFCQILLNFYSLKRSFRI
jgi:hypothetical protein